MNDETKKEATLDDEVRAGMLAAQEAANRKFKEKRKFNNLKSNFARYVEVVNTA